MLERILLDVRHALRQTTRAPVFAAAVVATLALAVGANASLFSLVNALLLRPVPVRDASRIIMLQASNERGQDRSIFYSSYVELAKLRVFDGLALYSGGGIFQIDVDGMLNDGLIEASTPGFFEALGLRPHLGRFFTAADAPGDATPASVMVVSHDFWIRAFGGNPAAIGRSVLIDGVAVEVIGVTPPDYRGFYVDGGFGFSVPLSLLNRRLGGSASATRPIRGLQAVGRLAPGVSLAQARSVVEGVWPAIRVSTVPANANAVERQEAPVYRLRVESLATGFSVIRQQYREPLLVAASLTAILLLVGCVNLSGLLLARTASQASQIAIRFALGASRARVVQAVVVESLLLSVTAAVAAVPIAWWGMRAATRLVQEGFTTPVTQSLQPDWTVFALSAALAVVTGLAMATLPAWRASGSRPQAGLRADRTVVASHGRWGRALLVAQVALALVLLVGAGLFAGSLWKLRAHDTGVRVEGLRWTRLFAVPDGYREQNDAVYYPQLLRDLAEVPGVETVAMASYFPNLFGFPQFVTTQATARAGAAAAEDSVAAMVENVTPQFFETVGARLLRGRDFTWADDAAHPAVAVVNETLSRALFQDGEAIGQRVRIGNDPARAAVEIVGVVRDAAMGGLRETHKPTAFRPRMQELAMARAPSLVFRATGDGPSVDRAMASVIARAGREYPRRFIAVADLVEEALLRERMLAGVAAVFAGLGLLLAFVGLYAVLAYAVAGRTREIGVRMTLGSSRARVMQLVVFESVWLTLLGVALGIPCALAAGQLVASMLFGLAPADPLTVAVASSLFVIVGAAAAVRPALRAASVDPATALRGE